MRSFLLALLIALPAAAVTVDRIAAVIDGQVLTVSEISQRVELRFFPRLGNTEEDYRREVLDALIAQALRYRDVERFGAQDIPLDTIEARVVEIQRRFPSEAELTASEISDRFDMSKPALSKHLKLLEGAGLVVSERRGQFVHYRVADRNLLATLHSMLATFCPVGGPLKREGAAASKARAKAK